MSKTKIILASTLSVLAVAGVTTAAVVVTMKNKKQSDSPKKGNEGNQVVVANDSKFEYTLNAEQTKELTAKLLLVKGKDVTVTLTENNTSKTITTKVKDDGTVDFSNLKKDGKTYTVTKIVVKDGEKERDLIAEVKEPNEKPGNDAQPGGTTKPSNPNNGNGEKPGDEVKPTEPNQGDGPSANAGTDAGKGPETGGTGAGKDQKDPTTPTEEDPKDPTAPTEGTDAKPSENKPGTSTDQPTTPLDQYGPQTQPSTPGSTNETGNPHGKEGLNEESKETELDKAKSSFDEKLKESKNFLTQISNDEAYNSIKQTLDEKIKAEEQKTSENPTKEKYEAATIALGEAVKEANVEKSKIDEKKINVRDVNIGLYAPQIRTTSKFIALGVTINNNDYKFFNKYPNFIGKIKNIKTGEEKEYTFRYTHQGAHLLISDNGSFKENAQDGFELIELKTQRGISKNYITSNIRLQTNNL